MCDGIWAMARRRSPLLKEIRYVRSSGVAVNMQLGSGTGKDSLKMRPITGKLFDPELHRTHCRLYHV